MSRASGEHNGNGSSGLLSALDDPRIALPLAIVTVATIYIGVLGAPFLWDDRMLVLDQPAIRELRPLADYFLHPFWRASGETVFGRGYYRPLVTLSYALDFRLHGANPAGFHATNLAFHLLDVALVFLLARRRGSSGGMAGLVAGAWGLAPRLTEAVAWVSGRTDVLATTCVLAALVVFKPTSHARRALAALLVLAGLLCKEVALAAFAPMIVLEIAAAREHKRTPWVARAAPWTAALAVYAALRVSALAGSQSGIVGLFATDRARTVIEALGSYAFDVAVPWLPRIQQGLLLHPEGWRIGAGALVAILLAIALWRRPRVPAETLAWLGLAALGLAPVLHVLPLPVNVVAADRFLYLPLAGLALAAVPALARARARAPRATMLAAAAVALSFAPATLARVGQWSDEPAFWTAAAEHTPRVNTLPLVELSNVFYRNAQYADALVGYQSALATIRADAHPLPQARELPTSNSANALAQLGREAEARALRGALAQRDPDVPRNWLHLALSDISVLEFDAARRDLAEALSRLPGYPQALELEARLPALEAEARRTDVRHVPPDTPSTELARTADLCARLARRADAEALYKRLLRRDDAPPTALRSAAVFLAEWGSLPAARAALERWRGVATDAPLVASIADTIAERERVARELDGARALLH